MGEPCYAASDSDTLIGPAGFECVLGEPEDRNFVRDLAPVVGELNRLARQAEGHKTMSEELDRLRLKTHRLEPALHVDTAKTPLRCSRCLRYGDEKFFRGRECEGRPEPRPDEIDVG
jgi:hypothetical protein